MAQKEIPSPPELPKGVGFSQVLAARGSRLVFVAGQISVDRDGRVVAPGDLAAQTRQVFENLRAALAAAGATFDDVVKLNYYVVDFRPDQLPTIREVRARYLPADAPPAATLVGVTALAMDGLLIEVEATALTD
jgi:enamine deaminase RidA (YjgF/YER057c/UK114 family)